MTFHSKNVLLILHNFLNYEIYFILLEIIGKKFNFQ